MNQWYKIKITDSSNEPMKYRRKKYSLFEKNKIIEQYKEIKAKYPKKGFRAISNELNVPKTCLIKWIWQEPFIKQNTSLKKNSDLKEEEEILQLFC